MGNGRSVLDESDRGFEAFCGFVESRSEEGEGKVPGEERGPVSFETTTRERQKQLRCREQSSVLLFCVLLPVKVHLHHPFPRKALRFETCFENSNRLSQQSESKLSR